MRARTSHKDLSAEEVVEIAEQIEEAETAPVDADAAENSRPADVDAAPADLDDVIDSVTSGPGEPRPGTTKSS